ncbi:nicotinate-nucleotide--dimethylbenzimidazole phosphoribosyltransferase [Paludicola sp. MB14-C6]|uniref:nicotinate-nucleotide--dimethylbenzimidazole phosphoribosyltransferase n=1 Tax=Paludihabitans sp. MB14-C6 TaxID=3070656 RepID=UPI0027DC1F8F|nr:nicotinate-nucleotide--dimethylbenzimidazole phosphoribosyltransferase [Paludicola sp. MB14-C6]WMJ22044.1 nicotinate-nucleotide--dimethylbenzimidazole phosphoribosyltransferase [Paludicola sp. MB14-C6]
MTLSEALTKIEEPSKDAIAKAINRWDNIAKPLKSLGLLESTIVKIAGIQKTPNVNIDKRCVAVMCADNGVVAQGVTQSPSEITAVVTENFAKGCTSVCIMAKSANADVIPIDIGVYRDVNVSGVINKKVMYGTNDMTQMPAMTREQAVKAIEVGINTVIELKEKGYKIIATGEMGIGNTTTSAAITSVLLSLPVEYVTGVGAGLTSDGLKRKINAIKKAIEVNQPNKNDPIDVLAKVGGLDIAGIVGLYIGGAVCNIPIMIDGVISAVGAIIALKLSERCKHYMIVSHVSKEPAGKLLLEELGFKPLLTCEMCLGEGTGAVAALPVIDMGLAVYNNTYTFEDAEIEKYEDLNKA